MLTFLHETSTLMVLIGALVLELAYALEEVIVSPYKLTGYLEIDAKNIPISRSFRYMFLYMGIMMFKGFYKATSN